MTAFGRVMLKILFNRNHESIAYFLYVDSCVFGARMDGKSKQVNSFRCPVGDLQHLLQILGSNFIKTKHIYWLFTKLK